MKQHAAFLPVEGFKAAGVSCGIKAGSTKKDLCLLYSTLPAVAAGVFTKNRVKAAPVTFSMKRLKSENIRGILANSGNANACTGDQGLEHTRDLVAKAEAALGEGSLLAASTGVIGVPLPMERILPNMDPLAGSLSADGFSDAAEAIMTTDTFKKEISVDFMLGGKKVLISGMAKGSGMIHPNMGTMLSFILTDAAIEKEWLQKALDECVGVSFNMVSVDGDTSTNDMALVLANGAAGNPIVNKEDHDYFIFKEALKIVCVELAMMIAKDGEGATKLIEVDLTGAVNQQQADKLAKAVISSNLVKAAFFGNDANWGRILCAMGYSGGRFDAEKLDILFESGDKRIAVVKNGQGLAFDEALGVEILDSPFVRILVKLKDGSSGAKAWGCDLSYDYVKINGSYRS